MSTRWLLVGLLVLLISSTGFALLDVVNVVSQEGTGFVQSAPLTADSLVPVGDELLVELRVPSDIPTSGTFLVDVYVISNKKSIGDFKITLVPSNKNIVRFTGEKKFIDGKKAGNWLYYDISSSSFDPTDGSVTLEKKITLSPKLAYVDPMEPDVLTYLSSLTVEVMSPGSFQLNLDKTRSEADYYTGVGDGTSAQFAKHTLKQTSTRIVRNTLCIKNADACSGKCGKLDNGCGNIVTCSGCATGKVCSTSNVCVDALGLALPNSDDKALCEAVIKVPATDVGARDALKGVSNALQSKDLNGNALTCETSLCKYFKLDVITEVLTAWFSSQ